MKRKLVRSALAVCLTAGMILGVPVLSDAKDVSAQTQSTKAASLWTYHITGQPGESGNLHVDFSDFASNEDLSAYTVNVVTPENCGITFENVSMTGKTADSLGAFELDIPYEIQEDFNGTSVKFSVQLLDENGTQIAASERYAYPYILDGDTLKYFDPEKGSRYKLTMDLDEHVVGNISGVTGGEYNAIPDGSGGYSYYLSSSEDSWLIFEPESGYDIADVNLIPADAGTVERMQLQSHGMYAVRLNAPATVRVTTAPEVSLVNKDGVRLSVSPVTDEMKELFDTLQLTTTKLNAPEKEQQFKENIGDLYADVELYQIEVSPVNENYAYTLTDLIGNAELTVPLPDDWDAGRSEGYFWDQYTIGADYSIKTTDKGSAVVMPLTNDEALNQSDTKAVCTYALVQRSIPTQVKDWEQIAKEYISYIRFTDWFDGDTIDSHFYKDVAPANDAAAVTLMQCNSKYGANSEFYNEENDRIEIPYDVFAADVAEYFINVPELTSVDIPLLLTYQTDGNIFCRPVGGGGNAPLVTEVTGASDLGNGRYAVFFKVSNKDLDEGTPDMTDPDQYTECTLTIEDSGKGFWKYVSFEKGYTEGTPANPEPSDDQELTQEQIRETVEEIESAPAGSDVTVKMETATVVPEEVLTAAKGKDVNIVLEMDGYAWVINGQDITDGSSDINLSVETDTNAVPADIVNKLADGAPAKQIHLAHNGDFGFTATLRIYVGTEYTGKYGNLFWYTDSEKFTYIDSGKVDEEGYVSLTFTHASDYVIVLNNQIMSNQDIPSDLKDTTSNVQTGTDTTAKPAAPETGDASNPLLFLMIMIISAAAFVIVRRNKTI